MKRKRYSAEFKAKAIELADEKGVLEAAEKLEISAGMLSRWRTSIKEDNEKSKIHTAEELASSQLIKCRQENMMLKTQLKFYKNIVMTMLKEIDPTLDQSKI